MSWLGFTTGMRYGEMTALSWSDVDVERGLIRVRKSQVAGAVGPTKTRMPRSVPIHPVVLDKRKAHREEQETKKVRGLSTGLVFPSSNGKHRLSGVLTKPLARCVKKAGVDEHVTAHTMRRTFNNLARQAAGEIVTRSMVGHATSEMTEHYSEVTHEEKQRALVAALGTLSTMDSAADQCWGSADNEANPSSIVG